ncbi:methyltransferase domain-containing protein [Streptosporangium sp. NPDC048047]|uniref:methyltransferase domain-containing protein n=1 Tax=Streptosporangium sp. NPDC048047 TaxID=3155748 RepID=UPI00341E197F
MSANTWLPDGDLSAAYARHGATLRGALRHALVARALLAHLPGQGQRVLDVGGGDGHQAAQLARAGHRVSVLDPDAGMLERARQRLAGEPEPVRARITLIEGRGEDAAELAGGDFDLVCCHGVLMYLEDPVPLLTAVVAAARPGGLISVLTKNADALAMRPALEGRWADALEMMRARTEVGNLGVRTRAHTVADLHELLSDLGVGVVAWYGVRVFTDHLGEIPVPEGFDQILQAEWEAGRCDPYRGVARMIHLIASTAAPAAKTIEKDAGA